MSTGEANDQVKKALPALIELRLWRQIHKEIIKDGGKCADEEMCKESKMQRSGIHQCADEERWGA